jgi:hypothetical protein
VGLHPCIDCGAVNHSPDSAAVAAEIDKQDRYDEIMARELTENVLEPKAADRMFFIALHAPFWDAGTGQDLYPRAAHFFRRRDGRIVGRRGVFDRLSREGGLAARAGPQVPAPP